MHSLRYSKIVKKITTLFGQSALLSNTKESMVLFLTVTIIEM